MSDFHIFVSYARKDNVPSVPGGEGWVSAFVRRLQAQHLHYAGKPLRVFFDTASIEDGVDWRGRLSDGLRASRLLITFLSPSYRDSEICRWEFEEYLRLEHTLSRGEDGVVPIFFVSMPEVFTEDARLVAAEHHALFRELKRRNVKFELQDWYAGGPQVLEEIDAEERLQALCERPQSDRARRILSLSDQLAAIDRAVARRLDQAALAEIAPGNVDASYRNFVGRAAELRKLHAALVRDRIGVVGAVHGLGGQGKTALAVQYAYAYAGHYAAGGRWLLQCEGVSHLADALEPLAALMGLSVQEPPAGLSAEAARSFKLKALLQAYEQSLVLRHQLHAASSNDAQAARDLIVSLNKLGRYFEQQGEGAKSRLHLRECFDLLHGFVRAGRPMDADMRRLHEHLAAMFADGGQVPPDADD